MRQGPAMRAPEIGQVTVKRGQFEGVTRRRDREFYEATTGFSLADAAKLHVSHIKGLQHKVTRINPDTNEVETLKLRDKPNYQALKDFQALVITAAVLNSQTVTYKCTGT